MLNDRIANKHAGTSLHDDHGVFFSEQLPFLTGGAVTSAVDSNFYAYMVTYSEDVQNFQECYVFIKRMRYVPELLGC